ncbi:MAG: hypothetical protein OP8BY_0362 [Candidatus Saccharicenans subterraneus]|uniref:Uncharacterized protein n=1 Tax=Candidatus Saccharicenans subterraneus TaxID=2508984 RepID=A0A3E2BLD3_9BACT|nr:MAG: hypothetical protein OP8BY_0362 [Candidatus Saccharicenans subterraneum]
MQRLTSKKRTPKTQRTEKITLFIETPPLKILQINFGTKNSILSRLVPKK